LSSWINFVKDFQKRKKISYRDAMTDPECKKAYHAQKSGGALGFKKLGSKLDNFGDDVASRSKKVYKKSINDLNDAGEYLGDTENRHYGRKINNYVQKSNQYVQAAKPVINMVPGGKYLTAGSQAQANLSNQIYKDSRKSTADKSNGELNGMTPKLIHKSNKSLCHSQGVCACSYKSYSFFPPHNLCSFATLNESKFNVIVSAVYV
jgi:hypothetical protein